MEAVGAILMGISLAACAGLRAFLPLLAVGLGARFNWFPLQESFEWMGSNEALITFGVATVLEILGDKVPVLDHALDIFHTVARPVAGTLAMAGAFYQLSPTFAVALGIIVGAPLAGGFHLSRATTRVASTHLTAGFGNPVLSLLEDLLAIAGVVLAIVAPVLAVLVLGSVAVAVFRLVRRYRGRRAEGRL